MESVLVVVVVVIVDVVVASLLLVAGSGASLAPHPANPSAKTTLASVVMILCMPLPRSVLMYDTE